MNKLRALLRSSVLRRGAFAVAAAVLVGGGFAGGYIARGGGDATARDGQVRKILEVIEADDGTLTIGRDDLRYAPTPSSYPYPIPVTCQDALSTIDEIITANPNRDGSLGPADNDRTFFEHTNIVAQATCPFGTYRSYLIETIHPWLFGTPAFPTDSDPAADSTAGGADGGADTAPTTDTSVAPTDEVAPPTTTAGTGQ